MLYYNLKFAVVNFPDDVDELMSDLNKFLNKTMPLPDQPFTLATDYEDNQLSFIVAVPPVSHVLTGHVDELRRKFKEFCHAKHKQELDMPDFLQDDDSATPHGVPKLGKLTGQKELTIQQFAHLGGSAQEKGFCNYSMWNENNLGIDFISNRVSYQMKEFTCRRTLDYKTAMERARDIMADSSLVEELERIYSPKNAKEFFAHPVHYKLTAGNRPAAQEMLQLLVTALKSNGRLLGSRTALLYELEENCDDNELSDLCRQAQGSVVAIDMCCEEPDGRDSNGLVELFSGQMRKYAANTLFVFLEITQDNSFTKPMLARVEKMLDVIELKEGVGNRDEALAYLRRLAGRHKIEVDDAELSKRLGKAQEFKASEVQSICYKWYSNAMKTHIYKAYKNVERKSVPQAELVNNAYQELQDMVGLAEVKEMVDQIINAAKMQKLRKKLGLKVNQTALHACFTGNPGCAKTTVARLLARILKKEGILETGSFVEVGRSDLVGPYVGWTAKIVARKFREARGGILFIDECYSLVDDSNTFGTEAINTIVQYMENMRDEVIVIFAGYPEKVARFLDQNEGLKSRISFHIQFPDYEPEALTEILHLMCQEKGYVLADGVDKYVRQLFAAACRSEEFGNGRFARNLLEQAIMKQADRLCQLGKEHEISRAEAETLLATDFEVNAGKQYRPAARRPLGFCG